MVEFLKTIFIIALIDYVERSHAIFVVLDLRWYFANVWHAALFFFSFLGIKVVSMIQLWKIFHPQDK